MLRSLLAAVALLWLGGCFGNGAPVDNSTTQSWSQDCTLSNWGDPCTVHASPNDSPSKAEIDLAVNPTDPNNLFVASKDLDVLASDCVWSVGQVSKDGGRTWTTVYVGETAEERASPTHPLFGWACVSDPNVAFASDGTLYYVLQFCCAVARPSVDLPAGPVPGVASRPLAALMLAISHDGGETFPLNELQVLARGSGHGYYHDFPRMAVSPVTDTLVVAIHAKAEQLPTLTLETFRIPLAGSSDGPTVVVDRPAETAINAQVSMTADGDGTFYLAVHSFVEDVDPVEDPFEGIFLYVSTDDGRTFDIVSDEPFATPVKAPITNTAATIPTVVDLASDPTRPGRLYAVWQDGATGEPEIFIVRSDDGGLTWTPPTLVNQDGTGHSQWLPRMDVAPDGSVHVAYLDRALDPDDHLFGATHAVSVDGGATWTMQDLTARLSDPDVGIHQDGRPFVGDYIGLTTHDADVWVGFPLEHEGRMEIAVAHMTSV